MEAAAAIGVAAAAMQFLDFSTKTLALCKQIRDSSTGSTEANAELTKSIKQITAMQKELRQAGNTPSSMYRKLIKTVQDCSVVASELLQLLEDFRDLTLKSFGAMRSALKVLKDSKKLERLQKRLIDCQAKFQVALTMDMRESVLRLLERQGTMNDDIRNILLPKLEQLQIQSTASHSATHSQLHALKNDLKSSAGVIHKQLAANHNAQQASSKGILRGQSSLGKSIDRRFDEASDNSQHRDFLASLYFDDMFARQQSIMPQSDGTYDWVLSEKPHAEEDYAGSHDSELRGRLLQWLQDERPIFWVNGKAASGKSSLMSFIESDRRTEAALKIWARTRKLYTFSFFFWRPGSHLQKSIAGLFRSILYQVTKAIPAVVSLILASRPTIAYTDWTQAKLLDALNIAFSACQVNANGAIFLLIDGLDEFEGSYRDLLDTVMGLQSGLNIKLCVSSRPETTFGNKLALVPSISLQELNFQDIRKYVAEQLESYGDTDFIYDVTRRAEGVFLWAVLVCQSLIAGHEDGDDEETMAIRLSVVPSGLEDLFKSMFSKVDRLHLKDMGLYFALLRWKETSSKEVPVSIALVTRMLRQTQFESLQHFIDACKTTHRRVIAQSKGLIQVVSTITRYETYDVNEHVRNLKGWALRDIATGCARHEFLDLTDSASMYECRKHVLTWIHRSAYDCILGDSSSYLISDVIPLNQSDFERQVLQAFTWLGQYTPVLEYSPRYDTSNMQAMLFGILDSSSQATSDIENDVFEALDTVHDAMQSSLFDVGEFADCCATFSRFPPHRLDLAILCDFWASLYRCNYWTVKFGMIKQSMHARLTCCTLLASVARRLEKDQQKSELGLLLTFLSEEYLGEPQSVCTIIFEKRHAIITCAPSAHSNEVAETILLIDAYGSLAVPSVDDHTETGPWPSDEYRTPLLAMLDAKQVYLGGVADSGSAESIGDRRLLQIILPFQHIVYGHTTVFPSSLRRMRAKMRLICLKSPKGLIAPRADSENSDLNHFDLSEQLTSYILESYAVVKKTRFAVKRMYWLDKEIVFHGTTDQREECLQLIVQEIWQNAESQLDAWHQLIFLARTKQEFHTY